MSDGLTQRPRRAPIDIVPVVSDDFDGWLKRCDAKLRPWVKASAFRATPASHRLVPDGTGKIACVLAGIASLDDPFALGQLPAELPAGNYRIAADWPAEESQPAMPQDRLDGLAQYRLDLPWIKLSVPFWAGQISYFSSKEHAADSATFSELHTVMESVSTPLLL